MEGARGGDAVRKANCQLVESSGGGGISLGNAGSGRSSSKRDERVNKNNASGAVTDSKDFVKAYPPDCTQLQTQCSELAGVWLELGLFTTFASSQHPNGWFDATISSEQRTVQGNHVPNSSRTKNVFSARTLEMILILQVGSTLLFHQDFVFWWGQTVS